jgi:hypothetical protein
MLPERLDYLWFLGFGLDDEIPDHSVLSKARMCWNQAIFESLFLRRKPNSRPPRRRWHSWLAASSSSTVCSNRGMNAERK